MKETKKAIKKVDTVRVALKSQGNKFHFHDILASSDVDGREYSVRGKDVTLNILDNSANYIIGLVETSRRFNVPPKKSKTKKKIESLGLTRDEGLAYGNVFVYYKKKRILMYEVNKNGCYLDHFVEYIYRCCAAAESEYKSIDIQLETVLSVGSYNRIINMPIKKSIEYKIANPDEIISMYKDKHDALSQNVKNGAAMGSDRISAKFEVLMTGKAKADGKNLTDKPLGIILQQFATLLSSKFKNNVEKLEVIGYEEDGEDGDKLVAIDLVTDRYKQHITIEEPRDNVDLLEIQRKTEIKDLYTKCKPDFDAMFKD